MNNKKYYISESKIHGKGIFANKNFKKGEIFGIIKGQMCHLVVKDEKDSLSYPDWIGIKKDYWIDPSIPYKYLNHSCNPSMGIKGKKTLVAIRNIKKGEEVTIDYSITEGDLLWNMKCYCKENNCRKIIKSIQFLPKERFKKYFPYIGNYFKNLYLNINKDGKKI